MPQLIVENLLPCAVFIELKTNPGKDEKTGKETMRVTLSFEQPQCGKPNLSISIRKIEHRQQLVLDFPDNIMMEIDINALKPAVNFETGRSDDLLLLRLAGLKQMN